MKLFNMNAWGHVLIAVFFGALLALAAGFTLLTTQLLFEYGFVGVSQLHYGWDILWQLNNAVHGEYSGTHLVAILISWILLACYMMASSLKKWVKSGIAHEGIAVFCHAMLVLDGIANWASLSGVPWYWQIIFTLSIYITLAHFGKIIMSHATLAVMELFDI